MSDEAQIALEDLPVGGRVRVELRGRTFYVFNVDGQIVAYENKCMHQGGPVCSDGTYHPLLSAEIDDAGEVREYHVEGKTVISCPWHGWEYDLSNGEFLADRRLRLRAARVRVEDGRIHVML